MDNPSLSETPKKHKRSSWLYRIFLAVVAVIGLLVLADILIMRGAYDDARELEEGYYQSAPSADLTVVEYLSYTCEYCHQLDPVLQEAIRRDGRITYIPRPLYINDPPTLYSAGLAYSAGKQGKFMEMHRELISHTGRYDESFAYSAAIKLGLDPEKLIAGVESQDVLAKMSKNSGSFLTLGGRGTPSLLIGNRTFLETGEGLPSVEDLLNIFAEARQN